jgi:excinuclease ABC subunit B
MDTKDLTVRSGFLPRGDQQQAIDSLVKSLSQGKKSQVLLGVTGSGKTFTVAKTIEALNRPALVLAHNKTLAGQLYTEFRELFPDNAVCYFVSYYDYYQPEAYVPSSDTYIEKDASINDAIDRMRHFATLSLMERRDVIIVASVSCIYGIGDPDSYTGMRVPLSVGDTIDRDSLLRSLVEIQYERNDFDLYRGSMRVRGDIVEVFPAHERDTLIRIEMFGDEIESLCEVDPLRGKVLHRMNHTSIYPSSHYVVDAQKRARAIDTIRDELQVRLKELQGQSKLVEVQRLEQRTLADLETLETTGYCPGIENYSRHLTGRSAGEPPPTLLDYFPEDYLLFIDESHQTIPQLHGMYNGDQARKRNLVDFGFRLPSALDNRPLCFEEFNKRINQVIYVSATPGDYEVNKAAGQIAEQIIRPTGLLDPELEVRPVTGQIENLLGEMRKRIENNQRILITTLTKRMAEELSEYYTEVGLKVRYLHSDIDTLERAKIIESLRAGEFDVLVGINLLREGLDIPEVSLVAIFDADKEGFLRTYRSLIQIIGRAARHIEGKVLLYADKTTDSMAKAIDVTTRRRRLQARFNNEHGITPTSIKKAIAPLRPDEDSNSVQKRQNLIESSDPETFKDILNALREEMLTAAQNLEFERAAQLRDRIAELEESYSVTQSTKIFKKSRGAKKGLLSSGSRAKHRKRHR